VTVNPISRPSQDLGEIVVGRQLPSLQDQILPRTTEFWTPLQIPAESPKEAEPVLNPPPIVLLDLKLNTDEEPRPEIALADSALGHEVCCLLGRLDEIESGEIERISIRGGNNSKACH